MENVTTRVGRARFVVLASNGVERTESWQPLELAVSPGKQDQRRTLSGSGSRHDTVALVVDDEVALDRDLLRESGIVEVVQLRESDDTRTEC